MRTVLVALDETDVSEHVARFVNRFFDPDDTRILALNVATARVPWIPAVPWGGMWGWGYPDPGFATGYRTYGDEAIEDALAAEEHEATRTVVESGIEGAEAIAARGDPVTAINRAAEQHDVDLIVVGTRDRGALQRVVFGSVSDDLVHHAERPVLVVR
ncbi:MAG: universal stress protein [Acidimicrobiales bacterium]|jgi:nucleotide-binding universal stress UspA family protein|nr:universal stress protein [Acidimicrobiales bacterium]